ncbi:MAG: hypothetical protein LQ349_000505 [Xanthoria aureola]|nr:MAG: hypothetical protein LQ349_000505 [Xanthoria aureola]
MAGMSQAQVAYQTEHIDDDRRSDILGTAISMAILSTIAVAGRFACRKKLKVALSYDDYSILVGLILNLGMCFDLGYESTSKRWRYCIYAIAAVCIGFFISGTITAIFQCRPISFFWTRKGKGECINELALIYFSQSLQVLTDILILTLPIPVVWKLRLRRSKKIGVLGIFLLGSFVCIAGIVRFFYIKQIVPLDLTWTQTNTAIWSTIEPSIGIVSACLPIMGPVLRSRTIREIRSTSWFTPSKSLSTDHHHHHHHRDAGSAFHKNMQIPEKPAVAYSSTWRQDSVDDVAMGCANGDVELESKR